MRNIPVLRHLAVAGSDPAMHPFGPATRLRIEEIAGQIAGLKPGRERDDETCLLWHRGLSLSDIALGAAMLAKAKHLGIGQRLRYA